MFALQALSALALLSACHAPPVALQESTEGPITRIAFGSCFGTDGPAEIWDRLAETKPEIVCLLGDNVYADTQDMERMRQCYGELEALAGFSRLRENATLLATWDDHDYGVNDGGADFPARAEAQQVFLDFLRVPANSPRRNRKGVYDARLFGPPGQRVQFLLLDTRYFRSPLKKGASGSLELGRPGRYLPEEDARATMLGEEQWEWLEGELRRPADLRILASSIQIVAEDHRFERWMNLPRERKRLFDMLSRTRANGVVAISGDRHMAEVSVLDPRRAAPGSASDIGYPFVEFTSSSLNRPSKWRNEINRHRLGSPYFQTNFGTIEVDWKERTVSLAIRTGTGKVAIRHALQLDELR